MTESPALLRVLIAAVAALFLGGVAGAVVVDGGDDELAIVEGEDRGDDATRPGGSDQATLPGEPTETTAAQNGPGETTATTAAAGPGTTAAEATGDPGQARPPKLGLYRYKSSRDGQPTKSELRVERDAEQSSGSENQIYRQSEEEGNITAYISWRADGVYMRKTAFAFGNAEVLCDWEPDLLELKMPVRPGLEWTNDSTCTFMFQGANGTIHRTTKAKVVAAKRVSAGGQRLDTWQIDEQSTTTIDVVFGAQSQRTVTEGTSITYLSPPHGLVVKATETTKSTSGDGAPQEHKTEREIQNLTPA